MDSSEFLTTISDALTARFGAGDWILASGEGASVYLNNKLISDKKLKSSDVENEVAKTASAFPFVARTYTKTELLKRVAPESEVDRLVARGFYPERSPDVIVVAKPYYLFGSEGTSHGTPYNYDTHVPLIFYGFGISAGVHTEHVGVSDVAPTLAALLHLQTPSGSVGKILSGVTGQ